MKKRLLIVALILIICNNILAQKKTRSTLSGWWVNTQYEYFKKQPQSDKILYKISPWFIYIDSSGLCKIELIQEQQINMGYPTYKKNQYGAWEYHYKNNFNIWLYSIKDNDSLLIYSNGITPGTGIIFKKYKK